jgi:hypothetical protein
MYDYFHEPLKLVSLLACQLANAEVDPALTFVYLVTDTWGQW